MERSSIRRKLILIRGRSYGSSKRDGVPFLASAVGVGLTLVCLIPVADFGGGNPCPPRPFAGAGVGLAVQLKAAEAETNLG